MNTLLTNPKRMPLVVAMLYALLVAMALAVTLQSLASEDFDGLNNMLQIPLALPWWVVVPAPSSHTADAWVTAGLGWVNAGVLYVVLRRLLRRRAGNV